MNGSDPPERMIESFEHDPDARRITRVLVEHVLPIADACDATAIFVYVDALGGRPLSLPEELKQTVVYVTKTAAEHRAEAAEGVEIVDVPNVPFSRMGQIKVAVFAAVTRGKLREGDVVVCLTGMPASGTLDTLVVMEVGREFEMFSRGTEWIPADIAPETVEGIVDVAAQLGREGREGKPVGALFVVGDTERVLSLSRQLILNPFRGYAENERSLLDPRLRETVKELATIDGAFVVRGDGVIETCGAYLKTAGPDESDLPRGLGARHHAAAGITAVTESIAVTVSESTGTVTIFRGGRIVTELEKPRYLAGGRIGE